MTPRIPIKNTFTFAQLSSGFDAAGSGSTRSSRLPTAVSHVRRAGALSRWRSVSATRGIPTLRQHQNARRSRASIRTPWYGRIRSIFAGRQISCASPRSALTPPQGHWSMSRGPRSAAAPRMNRLRVDRPRRGVPVHRRGDDRGRGARHAARRVGPPVRFVARLPRVSKPQVAGGGCNECYYCSSR